MEIFQDSNPCWKLQHHWIKISGGLQNLQNGDPCPSRLNCYHQKQCVETAHTYGSCTGNMIDLQLAITDKGYTSGDKDHLQYTFVYRYNKADDKIDGACGYWPGYYCHIGKKTASDGINKFALCSIQEK